MRPNLCDFS